jgi:hypothetical protein
MQNRDQAEYLKQRTDFGQSRLIGKISLWFSFLAVIGLLIVFFSVASPGESYQQNIRALSLSQKNLPWVMLVTGLILTLITGVITWLITLYSSFRITGPLFRFSRNVEAWINHGKRNTIPLRRGDSLQQESQLMEETINHHYAYLDGYLPLLNQVLQAIDAGDIPQLNHNLHLLKERADKASITHDSAR